MVVEVAWEVDIREAIRKVLPRDVIDVEEARVRLGELSGESLHRRVVHETEALSLIRLGG